jgi:endonuclease IV
MSRLGFLVGKGKRTMERSLQEDVQLIRDYGFRPCVQIFVTGPQNRHETLTESDRRYAKSISVDVPILIHGAYVDNPWTRQPNTTANIKREMEIAAAIGADGVIVHLGAGAHSDNVLHGVMVEIATADTVSKDAAKLYLEINTAKPSPMTYETPEKICRLFERIQDADPNGVQYGLCVDTAHVFSCGVALSEYNFTMEWLNGLPDVPTVFHLNDSASKLGSGVDRHEALLHGAIWGAYGPGKLPIADSGLMAVLDYTEANDSLVILERGEGLIGDLKLISELGYFGA